MILVVYLWRSLGGLFKLANLAPRKLTISSHMFNLVVTGRIIRPTTPESTPFALTLPGTINKMSYSCRLSHVISYLLRASTVYVLASNEILRLMSSCLDVSQRT
jgi:hypothetical protein